jgi:maleamate amidohydrolase
MTRIWDKLLSERDRAVYAAAGYGQRAGAGRHPALIVVDVTHDFVGDRPEPILDSIKRFPNSCGEVAWTGMDRIQELLETWRAAGLPVFYTKALDQPTASDRGSWAWKNARDLETSSLRRRIGNRIPDQIAPLPGETVMQKPKASAFFGTALASYLTLLGIDTVVIAGTTTSGCVRATAVDACSLNYRVVVAEDAVFDRGDLAHVASLFDIHAKYGDVLPVAAILDYVRGFGGSGVTAAEDAAAPHDLLAEALLGPRGLGPGAPLPRTRQRTRAGSGPDSGLGRPGSASGR